MLLTSLGSIGIGMVWGWLLGTLRGGASKRPANWLVPAGATALLSGAAFAMAGWPAAALLPAAAGLGCLLREGLRHALRRRFGA